MLNNLADRVKNELTISLPEILNEIEEDGTTAWHYAACFDKLKYIPEHLFTHEALSKSNISGMTPWHEAAMYETLKYIPKHLFTEEALNSTTVPGHSVFQMAAMNNSFKDIPKHLLNEKLLNTRSVDGTTMWQIVALFNNFKHLPRHLVTKNLLNFNERDNFFNKESLQHINNFIEVPYKLVSFIKLNPELERDIEFADQRLKLVEVDDKSLHFEFDGIEGVVILNKDGVYLNNETHQTLSKAVQFIENNYDNVEQSISLPANDILTVERFVL